MTCLQPTEPMTKVLGCQICNYITKACNTSLAKQTLSCRLWWSKWPRSEGSCSKELRAEPSTKKWLDPEGSFHLSASKKPEALSPVGHKELNSANSCVSLKANLSSVEPWEEITVPATPQCKPCERHTSKPGLDSWPTEMMRWQICAFIKSPSLW